MLPDIDSLALFVRAAELRSLTKAAEASHIGLAAASRRMALLEHRFKTALLERSPRGVELTPAGESLLPHARTLLLEINQMQAEMQDHADGRKGALRVQANTSAMTESLPADLAAFQRANPDIRLALQERWSSEIVHDLLAGEADVGIVVEGVQTDGLDMRVYCTDRIAVVMPADHPLARLPTLKFADVLDDDLVALESNASMMRLLTEQAVIEERTLQLRVQVRSFEAVCRMVQAGLGLGLLPFESASVIGDALGLVVRPLPEPWAERNMLVCAKKDRSASTSVAKLVEHLVSARAVSPACFEKHRVRLDQIPMDGGCGSSKNLPHG
ncbi:LysR family transcriptional regulator [Pseudorhodoferax sp.]|uniref:LysR family transcriptional regulator n=1 Tax=Pseudorhodoferax sp. TaxID=1993553 RepID=UPI0039E31F59